ncbi:MAG: ABC transporter substrate-binding protein [Candidatus Rokubacteria bacterium]|nr:ABC transporter substrate-binding protein [Candidatus Rokubacteria bacterium]
MIDRREFVTGLVAGVLLASRPADAQRARSMHRIGWLSPASAADGLTSLEALRTGLRELGYIEGQNVTIEARWADGRSERLPHLAADLVGLGVDVLCTVGSQASGAAKQATSSIPIVFANVAFPDQSGLVASYPRPGGNMTGVAFIGPEYGKRLELLREASATLSRVALIYNPDNPGSVLALQETQRWTTALGVRLEPHGFRGPHDLEDVFRAIAGKRPDALMTTADPLIASHRARIVGFAAKHRLLSMYPTREFVAAGGLMFYGGSIPEMYRRAAVYVDKILKGAKPGDLPVEQPIKFDMVINLKTAKALGLTIPQSLLLRADEVLQ